MDLTIDELREVVKRVLIRIKEEGEKGRDGYDCEGIQPRGNSPGGKMDFSTNKEPKEPNLYKRQGNSNMGPWTSESAFRGVVRKLIRESIKFKPVPNSRVRSSAPFNHSRAQVGESTPGLPRWRSSKSEASIWEDLGRWYDVPGAKPRTGIASMESNIMRNVYGTRVDEKQIGFKKLKGQLAHKKGVKDPGALAAYIGRKKYGEKGFAQKASAGRKKG